MLSYCNNPLFQRPIDKYESKAIQANTNQMDNTRPTIRKYYPISPYAYCAGNPINMVDVNENFFRTSAPEKDNNMKRFMILVMTLIASASFITAQTQKQTTSKKAESNDVQAANANSKKLDWAQFYIFRKDNARIAEQVQAKVSNTNNSVKAVLMGDSITELWWQLDTLFFKNNNFVGRGISGQTTSEMLVRFRRDVLDLKPQYVFIMAGTNDIAQNNGIIFLENILGNLESMVELAKVHQIKPILCSVLPAASFIWRKDLSPAQDIIKLNDMICEYASKQGIPYIDYHSILADRNGGLPKEYAKDGVHPNITAYKIMEEFLLEQFKEIDK